ncbi:type II restriction endonuclease, partial [Thiomonas arsenitoxydans]
LETKLKANGNKYTISGVVSQDGTVYPLGSDTKVLSTIFELFTRPLMIELAHDLGLQLVEPSAQNHYPDFTLCSGPHAKNKIAVDVKTTYIERPDDTFGFTLGGYTSFIRPGNESKNIVFPFTDYTEHWVIGYVYERVAEKKAAECAVYTLEQIKDIPLPYRNVRVFVQEKWRISSDRAGSGNTTNIGSLVGRIDQFRDGGGPFQDENEFLDYWRNYGRIAADRVNFKNIVEYRAWRKKNPL